MIRRFLMLFCAVVFCSLAFAQQNLDRKVTVNIRHKKISEMLTSIGNQGHFYFSYTSNWIAVDSVISITANGEPIRNLLNTIFNNKVDYKESPGYIILRPAPYRMAVYPDNDADPDHNYTLTGTVVDEHTGAKLAGASIYEPHVLSSTLTDQSGNFKLKVKYGGTITLIISKEMYKDTSVNILGNVDVIAQSGYEYNTDTTYRNMERSWLGRLFISSRQRIQGLNIGHYVATVPVQISVAPGLSSHGMMSSQIVNKASINLIGGYTAGVNGFEIAAGFNINRFDARHVQVAGLFNLTGGRVTGLQLSGLFNTNFKSLRGIQLSSIYNVTRDSISGVQFSGFYNYGEGPAEGLQLSGGVNRSGGNFYGTQIAGLFNYNKKNSDGFALAGIGNFCRGQVTGYQIGCLFNYAHKLSGFHLSPINLADSLDGVAVGFLNIARNGYHQIAFYADEISPLNMSFKTGNQKLYTRLIAGFRPDKMYNAIIWGAALGHDLLNTKRAQLSVETSSQVINFEGLLHRQHLSKIDLLYTYKFNPLIGMFGGPSIAILLGEGSKYQQYNLPSVNYIARLSGTGSDAKTWIGWTIGFTFM